MSNITKLNFYTKGKSIIRGNFLVSTDDPKDCLVTTKETTPQNEFIGEGIPYEDPIVPPPDPICDDMDLKLYLPMNASDTNPPIDQSVYNRTVTFATYSQGGGLMGSGPIIQNAIKRPLDSFSGYFPGTNIAGSLGMYNFATELWNKCLQCFTIEAYVYLPSQNLNNYTFYWLGNYVTETINAICGHGGPDTGGLNFGVNNTNFLNPRLRIYNPFGQFIEANIEFPLDTWVFVRADHAPDTIKTKLFINNSLVAESDTLQFLNSFNFGSNFFVGGRDNNINTEFNGAWRGYISDFKLYSNGPEV